MKKQTVVKKLAKSSANSGLMVSSKTLSLILGGVVIVLGLILAFTLSGKVYDYQTLPQKDPPILTEQAKTAVLRALDDEYKAYTFYEAVLQKFGQVEPFYGVSFVEDNHVQHMIQTLQRFNVPVPANPYKTSDFPLTTLKAACAAGVQAEISNVALYKNDLLAKVVDYPQITWDFNDLMKDSAANHIGAFQACE